MKEHYLHHTNYLYTPGGMQRMIQLHLEGGKDRAISFRDAAPHQPESSSDALCAELSTSVRRIRERYRNAVDSLKPAVSVYHNCWGVELVHDLDPAPCRVGFLHSDFPGFPGMLQHFAAYFDAFVNINPGLHQKSMELLPDWPKERFMLLDSPVELPAVVPEAGEGPSVIGIIGRIKREQKRLDRLPAFLTACDQLLDKYEVHVLGSGDFEDELRRRLKGRTNVRFLGWLEGRAYWEAIRRWRYLLFMSDYEGTPLSLIEGAHAGLCAVYPDFHPGAPLPAGLTTENLYPPGNVTAAAHLIARLEKAGSAMPSPLKTKELAGIHDPQYYLSRFHELLNPDQLAALPALPDARIRAGKSFPGWAPLSLYHMRTKRLRFGWRGIIRHS
ncbi:glycosyltransferase [Puniceicoccales bacterium CK1056]|uniref:Glycosyltransferase n=1 Tax=Oceanipulchritudo coccoides TaxID=2706888 RepID=A0A6B2LZZ6_9BACT|nr:glycosyltransferase [Oceanipulchritudo coccoides]NDV62238.1 glycosyltransferase [Oceanipulchritudo coccoides]